jgi:hypothetical protein
MCYKIKKIGTHDLGFCCLVDEICALLVYYAV